MCADTKFVAPQIVPNNSVLFEFLDDLSPFIPEDTNNEVIYDFIRSAFKLKMLPTLRADNTFEAIWEPLDSFLEILPAVKAGELDFCALKGILDSKALVIDRPCHNGAPLN